MASVLLVEDDDSVASPLAAALAHDGHAVDVRADAKAALDAVRAQRYGLVVLDLGLPDMDGLHVCRTMRQDDPLLPILILSARGEEIDTVVGLDAGADDYISKPFRLAELQARMRALLRRAQPAAMTAGRLSVEAGSRQAAVDGVPLELSAKEFDLLAVLVAHQGRVVSREQLARDVWSAAVESVSRSLDTHLSALRRKLAEAGAAEIRIATLRGTGVRLESAAAA